MVRKWVCVAHFATSYYMTEESLGFKVINIAELYNYHSLSSRPQQ